METKKGLSTHEAKTLLRQAGLNKISEQHSFTTLTLLLNEVFSLLNVLLILAAIMSFVIKDFTDAFLILAIVFLNTIISFWQEYKAEQTLHELRQLTPNSVRVFRDNHETQLNAEQIVPGDVALLETGDKIPADGFIIEGLNFEVNESALTGESIPVFKKSGESEHDQVFGGTLVTSGRALIKILATGDNTRFGKIAKTLAKIHDTDTPLQTQIKRMALTIGGLSLLTSALIYTLGIFLGFDPVEMFLTAVSSMVAFVPEGLPSIILITLAVGVKRMAGRKAIVRKMVAIEGLGSVNVICTDKTGTLTKGEMRVTQIFFDNKLIEPQEIKFMKNDLAQKIIDICVVVNTASLVYKADHGTREVLGDPTDGALLLLAQDSGIDYEFHRASGKILDEFSFDQKLKSMSTVWQKNNEVQALVKASPEFMLKRSSRYHQNGKIKQLDTETRHQLIQSYETLSSKGYRILGIGYKDRLVVTKKYSREDVESDLIFLGFLALSDPIRPEAKRALEMATRAGIQTVMITGDNPYTAMAIGKELNLISEGDEIVLGQDLEKYTDEELSSIVTKIKIFARTNPEDKMRIVSAFQRLGYSVAVTGDGVNDALALKQAEIGVAMGRTGTDVAKEAADIVITDDNYATLVYAIEEGRTIYDNVHKAIQYLLSTNIGEVLTILIALMMGLPAPLLPAQILWINLASDGLPAIALALDPKDPDAMNRQPRKKSTNLLSLGTIFNLISIGLVVAMICLSVYALVINKTGDLDLARTWTFTTLIAAQMIVVFIIRGLRNSFNGKLVVAVIITLILQGLILFIPQLHPIFKITKII